MSVLFLTSFVSFMLVNGLPVPILRFGKSLSGFYHSDVQDETVAARGSELRLE